MGSDEMTGGYAKFITENIRPKCPECGKETYIDRLTGGIYVERCDCGWSSESITLRLEEKE